jgi:hypothetical protein
MCCVESLRSWLVVGWFEILHDFIGLLGLYELKFRNLISSAIIFVLVFL